VADFLTDSLTTRPHRFVADFDPSFVQQIFDIPERQREPHVHRHRQADDLGLVLNDLKEWVGSCADATEPPAPSQARFL
jgi:hypothetical protein